MQEICKKLKLFCLIYGAITNCNLVTNCNQLPKMEFERICDNQHFIINNTSLYTKYRKYYKYYIRFLVNKMILKISQN